MQGGLGHSALRRHVGRDGCQFGWVGDGLGGKVVDETMAARELLDDVLEPLPIANLGVRAGGLPRILG